MTDADATIETLSRQHHFSANAIAALVRAMRQGGGTAAQFSHTELGGMGQWSRGGMLMIGDMFNTALKERVARLCEEIARGIADGTLGRDQPPAPAGAGLSAQWWPAEFGQPASSGAQNDMRYAFFPEARRLAVHRGNRLELYDTGEHALSGFSQAQAAGQSLAFASQHGPVGIEALRRLDWDGAKPDQTAGQAAAPAADSYDGLERLHDLHRKGVLTEGEFAAKKQELLARI